MSFSPKRKAHLLRTLEQGGGRATPVRIRRTGSRAEPIVQVEVECPTDGENGQLFENVTLRSDPVSPARAEYLHAMLKLNMNPPPAMDQMGLLGYHHNPGGASTLCVQIGQRQYEIPVAEDVVLAAELWIEERRRRTSYERLLAEDIELAD